MSHYTSLKTIIKRKSSLIKALESIDGGRWKGKIEVYEGEGDNLVGYHGDKREQKANVIVRRKHVGQSSNDIGFVQKQDGTYEAIISDFDSSRHNAQWLQSLSQQYSRETVVEVAEENGFTWTEQVVNGEIFIECSNSF